jgi:hypothetical protein
MLLLLWLKREGQLLPLCLQARLLHQTLLLLLLLLQAMVLLLWLLLLLLLAMVPLLAPSLQQASHLHCHLRCVHAPQGHQCLAAGPPPPLLRRQRLLLGLT